MTDLKEFIPGFNQICHSASTLLDNILSNDLLAIQPGEGLGGWWGWGRKIKQVSLIGFLFLTSAYMFKISSILDMCSYSSVLLTPVK